MKNCSFCGSANADNATVCQNCGIVFTSWEEEPSEKEQERKPERRLEKPKQVPYPLTRPKNHKNGGIVMWSVVNMLVILILRILEKIEWEFLPLTFCMLPGLIGLYFAVNVNNSDSEEAQTRRENIAVGWSLLGTVLGIITLIIAYNRL